MTGELEYSGDIAVVGMACRFPGCNGLDDYWDLVAEGKSAVREFSASELSENGVSSERLDNPDYLRFKGALEGSEWFDEAFFGLTPAEAALTDPQHRLFLECCWLAMENAALAQNLDRTGVFGGARFNTYAFNLYEGPGIEDLDDVSFLAANDKDFLTSRVSYKLGLSGPSVTVQTACSSSLVAVVLAIRSLQCFECDAALAGGVRVSLPLKAGYLHTAGSILSSDGVCRTFDHKSSGTVFGDGVGVVVLKRIEDAIRDRDNVRAIIKGSAINNDGPDRSSFTAPSVTGQESVLRSALENSGVEADSISYVECHGTGTLIGDPIEFSALEKVFGRHQRRHGRCILGSVKPNIGHLSAAAGIAGLIKTVLMMEKGEIPPLINFEKINPHIDIERSPFAIVTRRIPWNSVNARRAGVSSFGLGGANAHVILEGTKPYRENAPDQKRVVVPISAHSVQSFAQYAESIGRFIERDGPQLGDLAFTLQRGRRSHQFRWATVAASAGEVVCALQRKPTPTKIVRQPDLVFLIGSDCRRGAAAELKEGHPEYWTRLQSTVDCFTAPVASKVLSFLLHDNPEQASSRIISDLASLAHQYALAGALGSISVRPNLVIGFGLGEIVAASIAGAIEIADAASLIEFLGKRAAGAGGPSQSSNENSPTLVPPNIVSRPLKIRLGCASSDALHELGSVVTPNRWCTDFGEIGEARGLPSSLKLNPGTVLLDFSTNGRQSPSVTDCVASDGTTVVSAAIDSELKWLQLIADLWSNGVEVDWCKSTEDHVAHRIPLPDYPFAKTAHWIPRSRESGPHRPQDKNDVAERFRQRWQRALPLGQEVHSPANRNYVVVGARSALKSRICASLEQLGISVVELGDYGGDDEPAVVLDSLRRSLATLPRARLLDKIVLLNEPVRDCEMKGVAERSFDVAVWLCQALVQGQDKPPGFVAVSVFDPGKGVLDNAFLSLASGPARVVPHEYACNSRYIEIDADRDPSPELIRTIAAEIASEGSDQDVIRLNSSGRFKIGFEKIDEKLPVHRGFKHGGVYAITGGLGGMGAALAAHLAKEYAAKLLLIGRSALPPREDWTSMRADSDPELARKVEALLAIESACESAGGEVSFIQADVADPESLASALKAGIAAFGRIDGIVHAAGVPGSHLLSALTAEQSHNVISPKTVGTASILRFLDEHAVEFVILCSSLNSILPRFGQADYCAANAFLDYIALNYDGPTRVVAINWCVWNEVGMAARTRVLSSLQSWRSTSLEQGIGPRIGVRIFEAVARGTDKQVIVVPGDLNELARKHGESEARRFEQALGLLEAAKPRKSTERAPLEGARPIASGGSVADKIIGLWTAILGVDRIDIADDFFGLGGHSLSAAAMLGRLRKLFGLTISLRDFLNDPTPRALVQRIQSAEEQPDTRKPQLEIVDPMDHRRHETRPVAQLSESERLNFSLLFFTASARNEENYAFLIEAAHFADRNGLVAIWTPERHFNLFGGLFPNPALTSAALATVTNRVKLRAGSVILPLNNSVKIAEDWSLVDRISNGRAEIAIGTGWHVNDFVLAPANYADRKKLSLDGIDVIRKLWKGEKILSKNGVGKTVPMEIFPKPLSGELPIWLTTESREGFISAGQRGLGILTALLHQQPQDLEENIRHYHLALKEAGFDRRRARVALMQHTFLRESDQEARDRARTRYRDYLQSNLELQTSNMVGLGLPSEGTISDADSDALFERAFDRLCKSTGLIGSTSSMEERLIRYHDMGVTEIACLIDFAGEEEGRKTLGEIGRLNAGLAQHKELARA